MTGFGRGGAAIRLVFLIEAAVFGLWIPRVPDVKAAIGLGEGELGLALAGLPLGTLLGFLIGARVAAALGPRLACRITLPVFAVSFIGPGLAQSLAALFGALMLAGFCVALIEVAMNAKAGRMEIAGGARIMSQCHGFWSLGSMLGALAGGVAAQAGLGADVMLMLGEPALALAGFLAASALPPGAPAAAEAGVEAGPPPPMRLFSPPPRALVMLALMPLGVMAVEGAMFDWSALFMRAVLEAGPLTASAVFAGFSLVMAATRMVGDRLAERFGAAEVCLASGVAATLGIALFAAAPGVGTAFFGAALAGMGVAVVYPLAMSAAAARGGEAPEANVAAISLIAFSAFMVAPPLIGSLAEAFGLRVALAALVPGAAATALLWREARTPG